MTTTSEAYVWVWLPGELEPVVAGRIEQTNTVNSDKTLQHTFIYGKSYLSRNNSVPLFPPELPLRSGRQTPAVDREAHGCLLDSGPDYWGRRVILAQHFGHLNDNSDTDSLPFLTYLLQSGSDRIGALDFQESATSYTPRTFGHQAELSELMSAADKIQANQPLSPALEEAIFRGTSIGGARPKALVDDGPQKWIAKFSSTTDPYPVIKAEGIAMKLAKHAGINVAKTRLTSVNDRDVLLVKRFDRPESGGRAMQVSALTILDESPMMGHYATYPALADKIREGFTHPTATLHELFRRIVFNVCIGNTDDHARNTAAFWDGHQLTLTPAYDLCPQPRSAGEATHAMAINDNGDKRSRLATCLEAAGVYSLGAADAKAIIDDVVETVE